MEGEPKDRSPPEINAENTGDNQGQDRDHGAGRQQRRRVSILTSPWFWAGIALLILVLSLALPRSADGQTSGEGSIEPSAGAPVAAPIDVYLFWRLGCPYCEDARQFLDAQRDNGAAIAIHTYEVSADPLARAVFTQALETYGIERAAVPLTIVGDYAFLGFGGESWTGASIAAAIERCSASPCPDRVAEMIAAAQPVRTADPASSDLFTADPPTSDPPTADLPAVDLPAVDFAAANLPTTETEGRASSPQLSPHEELPKSLTLPIIGEISTHGLSLPVLTVVLAAVDGFNPCAMWVLVFLIGRMAGMQDRGRMWALGTVFLLTSGAV
ncbi:MAG: glutaredoxin domain-containing protein, partial [Pseudomonadota bacterium]